MKILKPRNDKCRGAEKERNGKKSGKEQVLILDESFISSGKKSLERKKAHLFICFASVYSDRPPV